MRWSEPPRAAVLVLALGGAACAGPAPTATGTPAATTGAATVGATASTAPGTGTPVLDPDPGMAAVYGRVTAPDGSWAGGVRVTLCQGVCRYADTGASGWFAFDDVEPGNYAIHVLALGDSGWAEPLVALVLEADEVRELAAPIPLAELGEATVLEAPGTVEVAEGLELTLDPAALALPLGVTEPEIAGATPSTLPPELPVEEPLAAWYLAPFLTASDPPGTVAIANAWGLAPGEQAELWQSSYYDYAWIPAGTVTVDPTGAWLTGGEVGWLTTLVLAAPGSAVAWPEG